jgi:hypothetical protein
MSQNNQIINYLKHFADSTFPVSKQRERVTFQRNVEMVFGSTSSLMNMGVATASPSLGSLVFWEDANGTEHCGIAVAKNGFRVYSITQQKGLTEIPQGARTFDVRTLLREDYAPQLAQDTKPFVPVTKKDKIVNGRKERTIRLNWEISIYNTAAAYNINELERQKMKDLLTMDKFGVYANSFIEAVASFLNTKWLEVKNDSIFTNRQNIDYKFQVTYNIDDKPRMSERDSVRDDTLRASSYLFLFLSAANGEESGTGVTDRYSIDYNHIDLLQSSTALRIYRWKPPGSLTQNTGFTNMDEFTHTAIHEVLHALCLDHSWERQLQPSVSTPTPSVKYNPISLYNSFEYVTNALKGNNWVIPNQDLLYEQNFDIFSQNIMTKSEIGQASSLGVLAWQDDDIIVQVNKITPLLATLGGNNILPSQFQMILDNLENKMKCYGDWE